MNFSGVKRGHLCLKSLTIEQFVQKLIQADNKGNIKTQCHCTQIAKFMGRTWGPPGSCRSQMGPCWPHEPCYQGGLLQGETTSDWWIPLTQGPLMQHGMQITENIIDLIVILFQINWKKIQCYWPFGYKKQMMLIHWNIILNKGMCKSNHFILFKSQCINQWIDTVKYIDLYSDKTNFSIKIEHCRWTAAALVVTMPVMSRKCWDFFNNHW